MNLYIAAPLFTEAERAFNAVLARALEADGHRVYLPQRDTSEPEGTRRTEAIFRANLAAVGNAEAVVAVCDGAQVDDGTAWEIGYAHGRNLQVFGLRTDARVGHQPDERVNLMILECLSELAGPGRGSGSGRGHQVSSGAAWASTPASTGRSSSPWRRRRRRRTTGPSWRSRAARSGCPSRS